MIASRAYSIGASSNLEPFAHPRPNSPRARLARASRALFQVIERHMACRRVLVAIWGSRPPMATTAAISARSARWRRWPTTAAGRIASARTDRRLENCAAGDMSPAQMRGAWAGEIGPASSCRLLLKYAVDFNGDGRRPRSRHATSSLRQPIFYTATAGDAAGWDEGEPNFSACWNGTRRASMRRRSPFSPTDSRRPVAPIAPKARVTLRIGGEKRARDSNCHYSAASAPGVVRAPGRAA